MERPIEIELPHKLGKEEARRRIGKNIHKLHSHIPGAAQVESNWTGEDQLDLAVRAMGQQVLAKLDVEETRVLLRVTLPGMLGMFGEVIRAAIERRGGRLLEDKSGEG